MRIYLAAPFQHRLLAEDVAREILEPAGHTITEKWWTHRDVEGFPHAPNVENDELTLQAARDLDGVLTADVLIVLNTAPSTGGKEVETGIAITMCIPVIVVGRRTNIFHYLPGVKFAGSVTEALEMLG